MLVIIVVRLKSAIWVTVSTNWQFHLCCSSINLQLKLIFLLNLNYFAVINILRLFIFSWKNNGNNLVYIPVHSVSGLDLLLNYAKILPPPTRLWLGSIVGAHANVIKARIDTSPSPLHWELTINRPPTEALGRLTWVIFSLIRMQAFTVICLNNPFYGQHSNNGNNMMYT